MARVELEVNNEHGLHARPAALFVQTAGRFSSKITLLNLDRPAAQPIDAKSIMSVLTAGVHSGGRIALEAEGVDSEEAIIALSELVASGLGESTVPGPPAP
jgi:phosphotransferase system HPr (HPr) family protein